jgi:putative FmdB family regulatory protein
MPTYEYRCAEGHEFERFQRISDRPVGKCPTCGARAVRKISGGQGLIFKGSGFYITDYGKDGKGPRKEPDTGAATPSGGGAEPSAGAGEAKPADAAKPASEAAGTKKAKAPKAEGA